MLKNTCVAALLTALVLLSAGDAFAGQYSQVITVSDYSYEIEVGGARDPVNETIIIENIGDKPIVNPRITVDGRYDWFDMTTMSAEVTRGCSTDEEKALAIFEFIRTNFHHLSSVSDQETLNPVISMNVYGYSNCAFHATAFVSMCRAVGVKARVWEVWHHTVSEAFYNNAWHMLDTDIGLTHLMDDNRTIASIEQLWADQKVTEGVKEKANLSAWSGRNKAIYLLYDDVEGGHAFVSQDGIKQRGYRYFHDDYFSYVQTGYDRWTYLPQTMALTLRPNEKIIRNWKGGDVYYDHKRKKAIFERSHGPETLPIRYGDGQIVWTPDIGSSDFPLYLNQNFPPAFEINDGQYPPVHVGFKQNDDYDFLTRTQWRVNSPYTIIGGRLKASVYRGGANKWDRLSAIITSSTGPLHKTLWSAPKGETGKFDFEVDLDETLYPTGEHGRHDYTLELLFSADRGNDPATQTGIESVEMVTDIQVAPNSLPALSRGRNVIRYRDETPGEHQVRITHIWRERNDNNPPSAPAGAIYPSDGGKCKDLTPQFRWNKAKDKDKGDKIANHWISVSFDPQCRWPVATAMMKVTDSGKAQWKQPQGWLNGDTTYYWKVKAQDSRGIWGEWSEVYSFSTPQ